MTRSVANRLFEWGPVGARSASGCVVVIVDVLRFSTSVEAATSRGAIVYPARWNDRTATRLARSHGAVLARSTRDEGPSLSPLSMLTQHSGDAVVLPSPNGGACSLLASESGATGVIAACLRNAAAVGRALRDVVEPVMVVACGEQWPDGTLRPALEDLLGAGAVLSHLEGRPSLDARAAIAAWHDCEHSASEALLSCRSGKALVGRGLIGDVSYAGDVGISHVVPALRDGAFRAEARGDAKTRAT